MRKLWLDNARALVMAVIAVLLVRFFCLEPFKIPTSSMEPTLIGDPACGDNILVNKSAYACRAPRRWEVVVFRYPLDHRRNFLKRLIGLPGEEVTIKNGNIYVNGKIVRKPPHVQASLLYPLFIGKQQNGNYEQSWRSEGDGWEWTPSGLNLTSDQGGWCIYNQEITNEYTPLRGGFFLKRSRPAYTTGGGYTVGEVVLRCQLTSHRAGGIVWAQIRKGGERWKLALATGRGKSLLSWYRGEQTEPYRQTVADCLLTPGETYALEMSNIDDLVTIRLAGQTISLLECAQPVEQITGATHESGVQLGGVNGSFMFADIEVWRDIYYLGKRDVFGNSSTWLVPSGHYFMLGDNPTHSNDSRDWKIFEIVLTNGMRIAGELQNEPAESAETYQFTDIYGMPQAIPRNAVRDIVSALEVPFVPREHLLGRALAVFWPPPRHKIID